jgi:hypothetical protein
MPTARLGDSVIFRDENGVDCPATVSGTDVSHPRYEDYADALAAMGGEPGSIAHPGDPVPIPNTAGANTANLSVWSMNPDVYRRQYAVPFDDSEDPAAGTWRWPSA